MVQTTKITDSQLIKAVHDLPLFRRLVKKARRRQSATITVDEYNRLKSAYLKTQEPARLGPLFGWYYCQIFKIKSALDEAGIMVLAPVYPRQLLFGLKETGIVRLLEAEKKIAIKQKRKQIRKWKNEGGI